MKKNVLSLSIAAMFGGLGLARQAKPEVIKADDRAEGKLTVLRVTDAGVGHGLVPYYSHQHGNTSVFHVVDATKPFRVRFRSVSNSDDIIDFREFLKPGDTWTAAATELKQRGGAA